ncbi:aldehyde dehydrogenase family protein [Kitasatospora sp. NPDC048540]|uniref:aldehyde dehydrogenase family protein n=1 Tax=Kitasatospora sp. NPDC048540 TaxID=3155634 RepID=UPI0033EA56A4
MEVYNDQYIGGRWRPSVGDGVITVINPATEDSLAVVPAGSAADIDSAATAARATQRTWGATDPGTRLIHLKAIHEGLVARRHEIADTMTAELGVPIGFSTEIQTGLPIAVADSYVEILADYEFTEKVGNSTVYHEPAGVVGAITPWNYPLHQIVAKVVPALAAGCTVVLKPAENTPLVARLFARIVHEAALPAGVFNLVTGLGSEAGTALAGHPQVELLSFTGSTAVGRSIAELAGRDIKRVALELGGKSANVVLPGADLATAVTVNMAYIFSNSGQSCNAWSRLLVHQDQYEEAVTLAAEAASTYVPGDPTDPETLIGPVVSARRRDRVRGYIQQGLDAGARLVTGGVEAPANCERGFYVRPTVLADVTPDMTVAQEEIFGPVLCVLAYRDPEHALALANGTAYGLAGGVWAADEQSAIAFARRMDTGQVHINGGRFNPQAPFGGYKNSGVGRELGRQGLEEFLRTKSLQF